MNPSGQRQPGSVAALFLGAMIFEKPERTQSSLKLNRIFGMGTCLFLLTFSMLRGEQLRS
jgi:hypothetical protein